MNTSNPHPSFGQYPKKNMKNCKLSPTRKPIIPLSQPLPGRQKSKSWNLSTLQCFTCFPSVSSTYLSPCMCVCVCACTKSCLTLCDPMDCSLPGSMEFSRQEYWSEVPFLLQGIFLTRGLNPSFLCFLHWQADSLPLTYSKFCSNLVYDLRNQHRISFISFSCGKYICQFGAECF